jgi:hypothetical protein
LSIDSNNRQRGNDEADAPLLVEEDDSANDVEVVIGAVESNETDYKAADELEAALGIKAKEPGSALLFGFWRNLRALLASTRGNGTAFLITTGHNPDNPDQPLIVHLFAPAACCATSAAASSGLLVVACRNERRGWAGLGLSAPTRHCRPNKCPGPPAA